MTVLSAVRRGLSSVREDPWYSLIVDIGILVSFGVASVLFVVGTAHCDTVDAEQYGQLVANASVVTVPTASTVVAIEPEEPALRWGSWTWTQHLAVRGAKDRQLVFGARVAGSLRGPLGTRLLARVDASAIGDGGAVNNVSIKDPSTFQTLEFYAGAYRPVLPGLAIIGIAGITVPVVDGSPDIVSPHPKTAGLGVSAALDPEHESYGVVMIGAHQAAGPGLKLLLAGQFHVMGPTYVIGDAALGGAGSFARGGVALRLK